MVTIYFFTISNIFLLDSIKNKMAEINTAMPVPADKAMKEVTIKNRWWVGFKVIMTKNEGLV